MSQINLSSQAKKQIHNICINSSAKDFNDCTVNFSKNIAQGVINLIIDNLQVTFNFTCNFDATYEAGEKWGNYIYSNPSVEINRVYNIRKDICIVYDAEDNEIEAKFSEEVLAKVDELITDFVYQYEETAEFSHYEKYSDVV